MACPGLLELHMQQTFISHLSPVHHNSAPFYVQSPFKHAHTLHTRLGRSCLTLMTGLKRGSLNAPLDEIQPL